MVNDPPSRPTNVVVIGGGFGGLEVAKRLKRADVALTLVDRNNYHLFQPLLYQVATGGLSPANIATPLRSIVSRSRNCEVVLAEVTGIDIAGQSVQTRGGPIPFDFLVVAAGAVNSYFGNEHWEPHAPGLKSIPEATLIRRKIFLAFETAERETDPALRRQQMTFVIVGGGPTGVELAGALSEIARHTLKHDFRHIDPEDANIILVEAGDHLLSSYPEELCRCAEQKVRDLNIDIRLNRKVVNVSDDDVQLESTVEGDETIETIPTRTILWAAGVKANPLGKTLANQLGLKLRSGGKVPVDDQLRVPGADNVFVIGDLAYCEDENHQPLPNLAPVAIQQGRYVAGSIKRLTRNPHGSNAKAKPFHYRDYGSMATIGRAAAIAEVGKLKFCGLIAWVMWLGIHLIQLVQFQNRMLVLLQWAWSYFTFNRSARIITGEVAGESFPTPTLANPQHRVDSDSGKYSGAVSTAMSESSSATSTGSASDPPARG